MTDPDKALVPVPMEARPLPALRPEPTEMSVADLVAQAAKVQEAMRAVMIEGFHYGKIPGCGDKPTLLKPGAEKLALLFRLEPSFDIAETDLPNGHKHFRVVCALTHIPTGARFAQGVGYGSTMESKYRWRNASPKCAKCGKDLRLSKDKPEWYCWAKMGGCGATFPKADVKAEGKTENADIADTYNTVLKMAKKRAQIDATLTATGASDIFAQDLEDLAEAAATLRPTGPPETPAEKGAAEMGRAFEEARRGAAEPTYAPLAPAADPAEFAQFQALCLAIGNAKTAQEVALVESALNAPECAVKDKALRQKVHAKAGAVLAEFKRAETKPEAGAAKPAGTPKLLKGLMLSFEKARSMEDVRNVWTEAMKHSWSQEDLERLTDRKDIRKVDFELASDKQ